MDNNKNRNFGLTIVYSITTHKFQFINNFLADAIVRILHNMSSTRRLHSCFLFSVCLCVCVCMNFRNVSVKSGPAEAREKIASAH